MLHGSTSLMMSSVKPWRNPSSKIFFRLNSRPNASSKKSCPCFVSRPDISITACSLPALSSIIRARAFRRQDALYSPERSPRSSRRISSSPTWRLKSAKSIICPLQPAVVPVRRRVSASPRTAQAAAYTEATGNSAAA